MREWLASIVGESLAPIMTVIVAAALVLLLALVLIGLAKRVFAGSGGIGGRSRAPRLAVLDITAVDPKRKLVLVRRDDVEHLILIGGQNDLVVEPNIVRGQARRPRQEPGFGEPDRAAAPQPQQAPLPHRRIPKPSSQPVPSDAQEPGSHPQIAPIAEPRMPVLPEAVREPVRTPAVVPDRSLPTETRAPAVVPPIAPPIEPVVDQPRAERVTAPPVAPPMQAPEPVVRPEGRDAGDMPQPVRRTAEPAASIPPVQPQPPRVAPPVAVPEPPRRSEPSFPMQRQPERAEPAVTPPEQPRAFTPPPAPVAPRPAAPPVAATTAPTPPPPPVTAPPAPPPAATPVVPPVSSMPAPVPGPAAPRSMATPTLPQLSRATPLVPPISTPDQGRGEPDAVSARSLWSAATNGTPPLPAQNQPERPAQPERQTPTEGSLSGNAAPAPAPAPSASPVRWPAAPIAPRHDDDAKAEVGFPGPVADTPEAAPAPLSVRSFATTIQERRTPSPAEPAPAPRPAPNLDAEPARAPSAPVPARTPEAPPAAPAKPAEEVRTLTLEEEMERLLHDFTIDVSDRR